MVDAAIIGTGPAGLSAALTLRLHNKSLLWFGSADLSPKVGKSEKIANYPGFAPVTGEELNRRFQAHAAALELTPTPKQVTNIVRLKRHFMLLAENDIYEAKTLLLATGAAAGKPLPGETELLGRGVSYCATCDGFLYKGKTIAVLCGSAQFEHEVDYLAELASQVYVAAPYPGFRSARENVTLLPGSLRGVTGEGRAQGITVSDGSALPVDGVFLLRPSVAPAVLLPELALDGPHITVNRAMETNLPGCYAAGDCTGRPYQIAKAVGEGNVAAHSMVQYLSRLSTEETQ